MKQGPSDVTHHLTAQCPLWKPCNLLPNLETRNRFLYVSGYCTVSSVETLQPAPKP